MSLLTLLTTLQETPTVPEGGAPGGGGLMQTIGPMVPLIAVFAIFYFVLIGPERKARKKREAMLKVLGKGDKVMTTSGMYATVAAIDGDRVTLQIDEGVRARFSRTAIQEVLSDDSGKSSAKS